MKQKDLAMLIAVAVVSGVISVFVARSVFAPSSARHMKAEVVQPISTDFTPPSSKYFNANSIDPTQPIVIGGQPNAAPFSKQ